MTTVHEPENTSGSLIAASKVNGTAVYNQGGEKLGSVYDVMLGKQSGKAEYAIMSFGGFLGIGDRYSPLPWHALSYDTGLGGFVVNLDRSQLEGGPSYSQTEMLKWDTDTTWGRGVRDYYDPMLPH